MAGNSGIRPKVVRRLIDMLNAGIIPVVPEKGSLGASGDLAPLAHMALVIIGMGEAFVAGERMPGSKALALAGLVGMRRVAQGGLEQLGPREAVTQGLLEPGANGLARLGLAHRSPAARKPPPITSSSLASS